MARGSGPTSRCGRSSQQVGAASRGKEPGGLASVGLAGWGQRSTALRSSSCELKAEDQGRAPVSGLARRTASCRARGARRASERSPRLGPAVIGRNWSHARGTSGRTSSRRARARLLPPKLGSQARGNMPASSRLSRSQAEVSNSCVFPSTRPVASLRAATARKVRRPSGVAAGPFPPSVVVIFEARAMR